MNFSLKDLRRKTGIVLKTVVVDGKTVILTNHGKPIAEISPIKSEGRFKIDKNKK
jgi:prevent-host-death family protein